LRSPFAHSGSMSQPFLSMGVERNVERDPTVHTDVSAVQDPAV